MVGTLFLYCARLGFEDLDSARQSQIEAKRSERRSPAPSGQGEEEDRFDEVVASPNLQNLAARSIATLWSLLSEELPPLQEGVFNYERYSSRDLQSLFQRYNASGVQALYCRIKRHRVSWKSSRRSDGWRNPHIFTYFKELSNRHRLPDLEFILITEDGVASSQPLPVFAFSKHHNAKNVALLPDFEMLWELTDAEKNWAPICESYGAQYPWEIKQSIAFFRGCDTGVDNRLQLILFSYHHPELVDATFNRVEREEIRELLTSIGKEIVGAPIETHFQYKYLFDVDGNASTYSRCRWILLSNCLLLKIRSDYSQWYYKALEPFVHFVPIRPDLSDLVDTLDFLKSHDAEARQIAEQGRELALNLFSRETIDRYVVALLEEYAKCMYTRLGHGLEKGV